MLTAAPDPSYPYRYAADARPLQPPAKGAQGANSYHDAVHYQGGNGYGEGAAEEEEDSDSQHWALFNFDAPLPPLDPSAQLSPMEKWQVGTAMLSARNLRHEILLAMPSAIGMPRSMGVCDLDRVTAIFLSLHWRC